MNRRSKIRSGGLATGVCAGIAVFVVILAASPIDASAFGSLLWVDQPTIQGETAGASSPKIEETAGAQFLIAEPVAQRGEPAWSGFDRAIASDQGALGVSVSRPLSLPVRGDRSNANRYVESEVTPGPGLGDFTRPVPEPASLILLGGGLLGLAAVRRVRRGLAG